MARLAQWEKRWQERRIGFHRSNVNGSLFDFRERLLTKSHCRVLVPLCGKTVDMKWLADGGHEVVGVEGVVDGIKEFFQEQNLVCKESDVASLKGAKLYQTEDGKIKIFNCDFFHMTKDLAGQFDAIWDRGSLVAIDTPDRLKYRDILTSLLSPGGHILIESVLYNQDEDKHDGPPHSVSDSDVQQLYGDAFGIELLCDTDLFEREPRCRELGFSWMRLQVRILDLK